MKDKIFSLEREATINRFVKTCTILENAVRVRAYVRSYEGNRRERASKKSVEKLRALRRLFSLHFLFSSFFPNLFLFFRLLFSTILSLDFYRSLITGAKLTRESSFLRQTSSIYTSRNLAKQAGPLLFLL